MNERVTPLPESRLLDLIYDGPLENQRWNEMVEVCRQMLGGTAGSMFFSWSLGETREYFHLIDDTHALGPSMGVRYMETFRALDPFRYDDMVPGSVYQLEDFVSRSELRNSQYYLDFLRPANIEHVACLHISEPGGMKAWMIITRSIQGGRFHGEDLGFIRSLAPHLSRALAIFAKLKRTEIERDIYSDVLRGLTIGTVILNQNLTVIGVNSIAEKLFSESDEIFLKNGRIKLKNNGRNIDLENLLQKCVIGMNGEEPSVMQIPVKEGHLLCLLIRRIPNLQVRQQNDETPSLIVYINDPTTNKIAPASIVSKLFGLTPAESTLAVLLASGMSIGEAARQMSVNENSARTSLKRIFAKTGLHRQTELVSMILKSLATLGITDTGMITPPQPPNP